MFQTSEFRVIILTLLLLKHGTIAAAARVPRCLAMNGSEGRLSTDSAEGAVLQFADDTTHRRARAFDQRCGCALILRVDC